MNRISVRLLGMTLILVAASYASPAYATNELGLSVDGVHWVQSIDAPLFDESMRWVPGDSESATFFVRNQGGTPGDLAVDVLGSHVGNLIDSRDLRVTAKGGGGAWTTVSEGGTRRLLTAPRIPDGSVVPIDLAISFDFSSPNATQVRASDVNFRVTLSESLPGGPSETPGPGPGLPGTGAPEVRWIAAIGAILIGVGLAFVSRRRDDDKVEQNV